MAKKSRKQSSKKKPSAPAPVKGSGKKKENLPEKKPEELMDMNQAIACLKTTRSTFYRWLRSGKIKGMKLGRQWRFYRKDIERFIKGAGPRIDLPADISQLLSALEKGLNEAGEKSEVSGESLPVFKAVAMMIHLATVISGDIHISPNHKTEPGRQTASLRFRKDGVLFEFTSFDIRLLPAIIEQWKSMAACNIHEKVKPQDGRIIFRLGAKNRKRDNNLIDVRVNFLPEVLGETLTARVLDSSKISLRLDSIGYTGRQMKTLRKAMRAVSGLVVFAGATGSGKTTSVYSCLNEFAGPQTKVMSIEDPVEYFLPWVVQVPLRQSAGATFPVLLRACLRSDPEVIMVGEVRDRDTLQIIHQAALTGHLVFTTLHTRNAAQALVRIVEMGIAPFVAADSLNLVVAQRLVRRLCPHCSVPGDPPPELLADMLDTVSSQGTAVEIPTGSFRRAVGCGHCGGTGFRGRMVVAEMLEVSGEIGKALRNGASVEALERIAVGEGMTTMASQALRLAAEGKTTLEEGIKHNIFA